jgi:DNA-binding winged helix-turn-helix (wHTH) protein
MSNPLSGIAVSYAQRCFLLRYASGDPLGYRLTTMRHARWSGIRCYRFGPFVLDLHRGQLWRGEVTVPITPKALEVLGVLVERAGEVVTKDELFKLAWPDTIVEENNLARHVSTLRKVLQERRDDHEYILTIPGRGYRFIAPVSALRAASDEPSGVAVGKREREAGDRFVPVSGDALGAMTSGPTRADRNLWRAAGILLGLGLVAGLTAWTLWARPSRGEAADLAVPGG